MTFLTSIT